MQGQVSARYLVGADARRHRPTQVRSSRQWMVAAAVVALPVLAAGTLSAFLG